ncbi:unnamed protein product [Phytophthora lilii]|uniref:Unnamed protein product n=1 Tax=Phytophthora lilii TaxID=2077276 RepID=A0A9W6TDS3_9STRA|nr:unnamed protein product [Phytophthora lilii]
MREAPQDVLEDLPTPYRSSLQLVIISKAKDGSWHLKHFGREDASLTSWDEALRNVKEDRPVPVKISSTGWIIPVI